MAYHEVLTPAQRQRITDVLHTLSEAQIVRYFTLSAADLIFIRRHSGAENQMGIAVQLCFLRYPGRAFEATDRVPDAVLVHVARQIGVPSRALRDYAQPRAQTCGDHLNAVQTHFGFHGFDDQTHRDLQRWLLPLACETDDGLTLVTSLQDELRKRQIIPPGLEALEEFVWQVRRQAHQSLHERLTASLQPRHYQALAQLVDIRPETSETVLTWLQTPPGQASSTELKSFAERVDFLNTIDLPVPQLRQAVPHARLIEFAREGAKLTAQRLNKEGIPAELRQQYYAWLVAFSVEQLTVLTDQTLQISDDLGSRLFRHSEGRRNKQFQRDGKAINGVLHAHRLSGQALIQARSAGADPYDAIEAAIGWAQFVESVQTAEELSRPENFDYLDELDRFYSSVRRYTPTLLNVFEFKGTQATQPLREAIDVLRERNAQDTRQPLPVNAPDEFVKPRWKPYVFTEDGTVDHRYYEFCVLHELRQQLRSGGIWVANSHTFKDFDELLIAPPVWAAMRQNRDLPVAIETDFKRYRQEREQLVQRRLHEVNELLAHAALPGVGFDKGRLHIKRLDALEVPPETEAIRRQVHGILPRLRITELMEEVFGWLPFGQCFTHAQSGEGVSDVTALLAAIVGEALNLSTDKMVQACPQVDPNTLASMAEWYLRDETYGPALIELANYHHHLSFAAYWGDGTTSASDAQFFMADWPRSALAHVSRHYGFQPGIMIYTHYSGQHQVYHIAILSPNEHQAPYMVDGLVENRTELPIREHYTDTGGFSDIGFAFCHLLGWHYAPRLRDFHTRRLVCFDSPENYPALASLIGGKASFKRIEQHWDDILRAASSVRQGAVRCVTLMQKLSAYPRQNNLALALQDLGEIERTLFMLDWLQFPDFRRRVLLGLQKLEWKHALARAVFAHRQGAFHEAAYHQQLNRASALNLVIMCIVIWNTVYMARAVEHLRQQGIVIAEEVLPHLSPLQWEHINFVGDFLWKQPMPAVDDNGFRLLRAA